VGYNRCLKYRFEKSSGRKSSRGRSPEFVRSSSFIAATGSGSSALLKSVEHFSTEMVERVAQKLGCEASDELLRKVQREVNRDSLFAPEAPEFEWLHRDLIPQPDQQKRGRATRVKVVNLSYESVFCSDTSEFCVPFGAELEFAVCADRQRLTTINVLPSSQPPGTRPRGSIRTRDE